VERVLARSVHPRPPPPPKSENQGLFMLFLQ